MQAQDACELHGNKNKRADRRPLFARDCFALRGCFMAWESNSEWLFAA